MAELFGVASMLACFAGLGLLALVRLGQSSMRAAQKLPARWSPLDLRRRPPGFHGESEEHDETA